MSDTKLRLLRLACEAAGGSPQLAARLGVPHSMLSRWLSGDFALPDQVFLDAVDLIIAEREGQPQPLLESARGRWQH